MPFLGALEMSTIHKALRIVYYTGYTVLFALFACYTCVPIKTTQSLKTEPGVKREIGYILCQVHVWKWPVVKYKRIKTKPRIYIVFILCLTWTVNANSLKQDIIVIKQICSS